MNVSFSSSAADIRFRKRPKPLKRFIVICRVSVGSPQAYDKTTYFGRLSDGTSTSSELMESSQLPGPSLTSRISERESFRWNDGVGVEMEGVCCLESESSAWWRPWASDIAVLPQDTCIDRHKVILRTKSTLNKMQSNPKSGCVCRA
jgi:hypothetical protein